MGRPDPDERRVFARMQEAYAAYLDHMDAQIGRFLAFLEGIGWLNNTLIVVISDNGATPEGSAHGAVSGRKHLMYHPETIEDGLAALDKIGTEYAFNIYPMGWAQASNTPLKWYKKDTHGGGIRDPLIVHWPARIAERGGLRTQYHHTIDVVPTVLEALGVDAPAAHHGVDQMPMHGISMEYTFDRVQAPTRRQTQYYELLGDRAIYHEGWKAVARHEKGTDFDADPVGAVPCRPRFLRVQRPGSQPARKASPDGRTLVGRGGCQQRAAAGRPRIRAGRGERCRPDPADLHLLSRDGAD